MTPHCMMWCIWRERNIRNFEDCERTTVELKDILFKTLHGWMIFTNSFRFANFVEFQDLCSFSLVGVPLVYSLCTWVAPLCTFNKIELLIKKNIPCSMTFPAHAQSVLVLGHNAMSLWHNLRCLLT
jgi:hypothetical protein